MTEPNAEQARRRSVASSFRSRRQSLSPRSRSMSPSSRSFPTPTSLSPSPDSLPVPVTKGCTICAESKEIAEFPDEQISELCLHQPGVCLACIQTSIRVDFHSKRWNQIDCPECLALLDYHHVRKYADEDTFARYEVMSLRAAVGEDPDFVWCLSDCGAGQVHETGHAQPIVTCVQCKHRSCFVHQVPWHEGLSCTDYDAIHRDPRGSKRQADTDNDAIEERARKRQKQVDDDRLYAQSLVEGEQPAEASVVGRRENEQAEQALRQREQEVEEARRKAVRDLAEQIRLQEQSSLDAIRQTTKACPGCGWAIEKASGCDHMTCTQCDCDFCYECGADYDSILAEDNTQHRADCSYYG